jgi:D-beta-D-heptose 7-phosphate kinase/D-beta-D-heptose 1-phosphate adenosyltransferase
MGRVVSQEELLQMTGRPRRGPRRVVFTNGCFDLLHPGHIDMLEDARSRGDVLIVGVNSDRSVHNLKGPGRPVMPAEERAEILAALAAVDFVVIFDEDDPRQLITRLLPDVLAKGGDWPVDKIIGREEVEAAGGEVVSIPFRPPWSTSNIIFEIIKNSPTGSLGRATA